MQIINPFAKEVIKVETEFCGQNFSLEVNRLAFRSQAAVLATWGQTVVLATVNIDDVDPGTDYFPLNVEYQERFYAAGKISGSRYIKREARPSDDAVLISRLIDRPLRPLFPKGYHYPVQVVVTVLSLDPKTRPDFVAMTAASAALSLTGAPFNGPVAGVRMGCIDGKIIACPDHQQMSTSSLDLMVAANRKGVMMVEASAQQVTQQIIVEALRQSQSYNQILLDLQQSLVSTVQPQALDYQLIKPSEAIQRRTDEWLQDKLPAVLEGNYAERIDKIKALNQAFKQYLADIVPEEELATDLNIYQSALEAALDQGVRHTILHSGQRLDKRAFDEVRPLSSQVGVLPRTHGSALFTRGATQALNIVTLAAPSFSQSLDTMEKDEEKYYFHHYNAPGYTVGEVKRMGSTNRREIGHSYLAEKALIPVLPDLTDFPYTIRSVTEIMSQQGSTSMAATCASCLALMDAGVPIKSPVAGVAMGLILKDDQTPIFLTDIADAEDFAGDMDFKVAGTKQGITALQMDMKVPGLSIDILSAALEAAEKGRFTILEHMLTILPQPRPELNPYAPRTVSLKVPVNKIKDLIGKGGETIHALTAETGAQIDIKDDGQVFIYCHDQAALQSALSRIKEITEDPQIGHVYHDRTVVKLMDFGAFVSLGNGHDGLVHVSEISDHRVAHPSDVLKEGDKVTVKLIAIDEQGRFNLSIKRALK